MTSSLRPDSPHPSLTEGGKPLSPPEPLPSAVFVRTEMLTRAVNEFQEQGMRSSDRMRGVRTTLSEGDAAGIRSPVRQTRIGRTIIAGCLALLVGGAVTLLGRFDYQCAAVIRLPRGTTEDDTARRRAELLAYAGERLARTADDRTSAPVWTVDSPANGTLRLVLTSGNTATGIERVRALAQGFVTHTQLAAIEARSAPTEVERMAADYVQELQSRLADAEAKVNAALSKLPAADPQQDREALLRQWDDLRSRFVDARERLGASAALNATLAAKGEPTHAIVPAEERRAALDADEVLQQDLRELTVALTETKLQLLNVWQKSSVRLDSLESAARKLAEAGARASSGGRSSQDADAVARECNAYLELLKPFRENWTREFTLIREHVVDAMHGDLLDAHQRLRGLLNDFLFAADKRLAVLRGLADPVRAGGDMDAKRLVVQSGLTRAYHELEAMHHQFEFAAGDLDARDNFRLDSALNKSRGLRRRTQEQIRAIDDRLHAAAARQSRERYLHEREEAARELSELRASTDRTIEELVALQEQLNINAGLSEQFLKSMVEVEIERNRMKSAESDLRKREEQLRQIAARREATPDGRDIEVAAAGVMGAPVNLGERFRSGGVAAAAAFAAVLFAQGRFARRP